MQSRDERQTLSREKFAVKIFGVDFEMPRLQTKNPIKFKNYAKFVRKVYRVYLSQNNNVFAVRYVTDLTSVYAKCQESQMSI